MSWRSETSIADVYEDVSFDSLIAVEKCIKENKPGIKKKNSKSIHLVHFQVLGIDNIQSDIEESENQFQHSGNRCEAEKIEHIFFILSSASLVLF